MLLALFYTGGNARSPGGGEERGNQNGGQGNRQGEGTGRGDPPPGLAAVGPGRLVPYGVSLQIMAVPPTTLVA